MNCFSLSLLLVACVVVTIPSTSASASASASVNDDITKIIMTHLTRASHSFRTLQSTPTSSVFGAVNGASAACKASSVLLETNSAIIAANASVIASGCTDPAKATCNLSSPPYGCKCIATYSNDANLRSLVSQSGGRVCSFNIFFTATYSNGVSADFDFQGAGGLGMVGSECTNNGDIQAVLIYAMDGMAQGFRESKSSNPVRSFTGTFSFCGTSYTGTRNDAYNQKPIAIIIASLIGIIITIINITL